MNELESVADKEELYRSVRANLDFDEYYHDDDGNLIITRKAFKDRNKEPSVDRAILINSDPKNSKKSDDDGIVTIVACDVRKIGDIITKKDDHETIQHTVDITPDPTDDNEAHALITVDPKFFGSDKKQKKAFKLLRIALARLATKNGWTIEPDLS